MNRKKIVLGVEGMTCASCALSNENALLKAPGVLSANVNFASKKALVEYDADVLDKSRLVKIIQENGYLVSEKGVSSSEEKRGFQWRAVFREKFFLSGMLTLFLVFNLLAGWKTGWEIESVDLVVFLNLFLAAGAVFFFGFQFHRKAFSLIKKFQFNMDSLVSLGSLAAFGYSFWAVFFQKTGYLETGPTIITLILLGKYLEKLSVEKTRQTMSQLMEMGANVALRIKNGKEEPVAIAEIKVGDILLVKPGEKIPLDGEVIEGETSVDESTLSGEAWPVEKQLGSQVFGATLNEHGVIKIKVNRTGEKTVLAQIIRAVEEAQSSKAPIQKLADKIAGIFVPVVMIISFFTFLGWLFFSGNLSSAVLNAVAVLVVACPCALGLATPTAVMAGTGNGAKKGILFKSGESFQRAKDISLVIFDKTGTLTKGQPKVLKVVPNLMHNFPQEKLLQMAASLAQNSNHPLSRAVAVQAETEGLSLLRTEKVKEIKGKGVVAFWPENNSEIALGNRKLAEDQGVSLTSWKDWQKDQGEGTLLFVIWKNNLVGYLVLADEIRQEAKSTVEKLFRMNLEVAIISGDNQRAVSSVAKKLGIEKFWAELLPQEKSEKIKELQAQGQRVVFVGDGINDAASLIQADLGIAMGGAADIAREAGQVTLVWNNLEKVIQAIQISQRTFHLIRQNLFWAFLYNSLSIPLAALGFLSPVVAAGAMSFSSISVVLNSLRMYRK